MNFLFTIYGTIYTTTYSGIFSAQTLYTVVFLRLGTMGSLKHHYTIPLCICLISEQDRGFLYIGVYSYGIALYSNRHSSLSYNRKNSGSQTEICKPLIFNIQDPFYHTHQTLLAMYLPTPTEALKESLLLFL